MTTIDYAVLVAYFTAMAVIGYLCMLRVKSKEDFFLGGRSFGKVMQTFAAFGAGTGANDPVAIGRTTYTSGLSGIWVVLLWLFVTPFYWIIGVWYRRMRHLTTGDWFVERYESNRLGAVYALFGLTYYTVYLSVAFSSVGKVSAYLMETEGVTLSFISGQPIPTEAVVIPVVALVVILYGVLGGLRAAYWTDLVQGVFIILLSVLLIPFGLNRLVEDLGNSSSQNLLDGFRILHEQLPAEYFQIVESPRGGEFPWHYILAITLLNLIGIVVQPHLIATGGGSAKTENSARVGLVVGNFLKRLCTVGWALTALIVIALFVGDEEIANDPDRVWGVAALEILGPLGMGLVGLMLACLLAALMSSADCYMLVCSGLIVRNLYAPFLNPQASERQYVLMGRLVSFVLVFGAAIISLLSLDVFRQLKFAWEITVICAAPFWVGMFWRGATRTAAWFTVAFSALTFFAAPIALPMLLPNLRTDERFLDTNTITRTYVTRRAAPADVAKRELEIRRWEARRLEADALEDSLLREALGDQPQRLRRGELFRDFVYETGGKAVFWRSGVQQEGGTTLVEVSREMPAPGTEVVRYAYRGRLQGAGFFNLELLAYDLLGLDLTRMDNATLETLRLPPRLIVPFLIMIVLSLFTRPGTKEVLDRFYVKMKTPTQPDPEADRRELAVSYANPARFDHKKLFPGTSVEIQKPTLVDTLGFLLAFAGCFAVIGLAVWVASVGSGP